MKSTHIKPHSYNSRQLNQLAVSAAKWLSESPRPHPHLSGHIFLLSHSSPAPQLVYEAVSYPALSHKLFKLFLLAKTPSQTALSNKNVKPPNYLWIAWNPSWKLNIQKDAFSSRLSYHSEHSSLIFKYLVHLFFFFFKLSTYTKFTEIKTTQFICKDTFF